MSPLQNAHVTVGALLRRAVNVRKVVVIAQKAAISGTHALISAVVLDVEDMDSEITEQHTPTPWVRTAAVTLNEEHRQVLESSE